MVRVSGCVIIECVHHQLASTVLITNAIQNIALHIQSGHYEASLEISCEPWSRVVVAYKWIYLPSFPKQTGSCQSKCKQHKKKGLFCKGGTKQYVFLGDHGYSLGALQDCKNNISHGLTKRLGGMCGKNNSRDWWRTLNRGPVPELI